jgi:hypothetical protein
MLIVLGIYFIIMIALCFYSYSMGYSKGKEDGVQEERQKYRDHIEVATKETVVG